MSGPVEVARCFGQNLVVYRKRADLSQEELAIRAALHRTEIGHLERGARMPRIDTLVKLAGALTATPADLLEGVTWTPGEMSVGRFKT